MSRSLKKGPFADASLLKKIDAANASDDKTVIKTWSPHRQSLCSKEGSVRSVVYRNNDRNVINAMKEKV